MLMIYSTKETNVQTWKQHKPAQSGWKTALELLKMFFVIMKMEMKTLLSLEWTESVTRGHCVLWSDSFHENTLFTDAVHSHARLYRIQQTSLIIQGWQPVLDISPHIFILDISNKFVSCWGLKKLQTHTLVQHINL